MISQGWPLEALVTIPDFWVVAVHVFLMNHSVRKEKLNGAFTLVNVSVITGFHMDLFRADLGSY